ncbi:MAG: hypothetical protein AAFX81_19595 [Pseudomonadota bacterium]
MPNTAPSTLGKDGALRLEFTIIGLGIVALVMIFQPLLLPLFSVGCALVVVAALANNLLPLAEPQTPVRRVVTAALVIALIFTTALLLAIVAAYLYGVAFLEPPDPSTSLRPPRPPFWQHPFVWGLVAVEIALIAVVRMRTRGR